MQRFIFSLFLACLTLGCAGAQNPSAPPGPPPRPTVTGPRLADSVLYVMLARVPLDSMSALALDDYELSHPRDFMERIGLVAEDSGATVEQRYNAVRLIGERRNAQQLPSLRVAFRDPDPRVRAAVLVATARIIEKNGEGRSLLESALDDPAPEVQAKALELLGTSSLEALRALVARQPQGEIARIARALIRAEEERGAPLAGDTAGVLRRTLDEGVTLVFTPTRRWPEWKAAVGTLAVTPKDGSAFKLEGVEVVQNVVPAFFSPDARYMVYEHGREIHVRELKSGTTRSLGPGLAPRPRPFAEDFVFMREVLADRGDVGDRIRQRFHVLRAGFEPTAAKQDTLGALAAFTQHTINGNFSPLRWLRVVEREGSFTLEAAGMETFNLPAPFQRDTTR